MNIQDEFKITYSKFTDSKIFFIFFLKILSFRIYFSIQCCNSPKQIPFHYNMQKKKTIKVNMNKALFPPTMKEQLKSPISFH